MYQRPTCPECKRIYYTGFKRCHYCHVDLVFIPIEEGTPYTDAERALAEGPYNLVECWGDDEFAECWDALTAAGVECCEYEQSWGPDLEIKVRAIRVAQAQAKQAVQVIHDIEMAGILTYDD